MMIDWENFTPWFSLAGGVLIGLSAALLILMNGRILGVSGIVSGLLPGSDNHDRGWRLSFIAGLASAAFVSVLLGDHSFSQIQIDAGYGLIIIAGLLVGLGTRIGSGCTSGHGVCGISRLSPRSIVATLTFMLSGMMIVYLF